MMIFIVFKALLQELLMFLYSFQEGAGMKNFRLPSPCQMWGRGILLSSCPRIFYLRRRNGMLRIRFI